MPSATPTKVRRVHPLRNADRRRRSHPSQRSICLLGHSRSGSMHHSECEMPANSSTRRRRWPHKRTVDGGTLAARGHSSRGGTCHAHCGSPLAVDRIRDFICRYSLWMRIPRTHEPRGQAFRRVARGCSTRGLIDFASGKSWLEVRFVDVNDHGSLNQVDREDDSQIFLSLYQDSFSPSQGPLVTRTRRPTRR